MSGCIVDYFPITACTKVFITILTHLILIYWRWIIWMDYYQISNIYHTAVLQNKVKYTWPSLRVSLSFKLTPLMALKHSSSHWTIVKIFLQVLMHQLTCGGPNSSDQDGGYGHNDAAEGSQEGKDLGIGSWRGRKHPLKIDLPGNSPQHLGTRKASWMQTPNSKTQAK